METRMLFTSDLHGSDACFLKVLSAAKRWKVNILCMSGDLTGKAIIPIVKFEENLYVAPFFGKEHEMEQTGLKEFEEKVAGTGHYFYECSKEECDALRANPEEVEKLFQRLMEKRLEEWILKSDEILPRSVKVILNSGNDDPFFVDKVLQQSRRTIYSVEEVEQLDDRHSLVSYNWVNPTPWRSPRECSEGELEKRLRKEFERASSAEHLLCDFHAPPYDCPLDLAPKLDSKLRPKMSLDQPLWEHVGSRAVRKVIEEYQPELTLHGHIHESPGAFRIGKTLCINPGSEYVEGIMHGYLLQLTPEGIDYRFLSDNSSTISTNLIPS